MGISDLSKAAGRNLRNLKKSKVSLVYCPNCGSEVWDVMTPDQRLNKCWGCGLGFDSPEGD